MTPKMQAFWNMTPWHFIFPLIFFLETPKDGFGPINFWKEESPASLSAISFPRNPAVPGTQYSPTVCRVVISFNAFWHCLTIGDVVLRACRVFRTSWLSERILKYLRSCIRLNFTNTDQDGMHRSLKNCSTLF